MNRKDRRAAEAASRREPKGAKDAKDAKNAKRSLPLAPNSPGATHAFHARRVATAATLERPRDPAAVMEAARETLAFGDALIAREATEQPVACAKGCHFCCHLDVAASPPEALLVADRLRRSLDPDALRATRAKLVATEAALRAPAAKGDQLRVPCAFLGEAGTCSIYELRPLPCRGWNSFSVSACEQGFERGDATSSVPLDQNRMTAASAVAFATWTGAADVGLDGRPVRLVAAVRAALDDPAWIERWLRKEPLPAELVHQQSARAWAKNAYPPLFHSIALASEPH